MDRERRKETIAKTHLFLRRWARSFKRGWRLFRQSSLGIAGLAIIAAFGVMALFAPWLAPYPQDFLAPEQDVFFLNRYSLNYSEASEFHPPVTGPTVPTFITQAGGQWVIVAERGGTIFMDLGQRPVGNQTPFQAAGNVSHRIDISELGLEPPLSEVVYIAQGLDAQRRLGERVNNGLLAFVANQTFVVLDPFEPAVLYNESLDFRPRWVDVDPASAGDIGSIPTQTQVGFFSFAGPFRYLTVANETRVVGYSMEYLNNAQGVRSLERVLDTNVTVTEAPLPFNNSVGETQRSGFYVPSGDRLLIYNVTGVLRTEFTLTLDNETATVTAPLGYTRGDFPHYLFVPVKSERAAGVLFLSQSGDQLVKEFRIPDPRAVVVTKPDTSPAGWLHVGANFPGGDPPARVYRVNFDTLRSPEGFQGDMPEPLQSLYLVTETSRIIVLGESTEIYKVSVTGGGGLEETGRGGVSPFIAPAEEGPRYISFVGSFGGTRYGRLSAEEVHGLYFDPQEGQLVVHQFIGSTVAPLPPGTYESGNTYIFGTDNLGHDILTQLIYGSQVAFIVGVLAAFFAVVVGTFIGLVSGYFGDLTDVVLMRVTDIALVLPGLPVILILTAILGPNIWNIILVIAIIGWPGIARVIRAQTLSLKERPFVDAARVSGAGDVRIMFKHLAPNVLPFTFLYMTLLVAGAILTEAALSFLGLGDPRVITWGIMLSTIQTSGSLWAWWWLLPPGLSITLISLGFYLVGRAADEIVNPRLRKR